MFFTQLPGWLTRVPFLEAHGGLNRKTASIIWKYNRYHRHALNLKSQRLGRATSCVAYLCDRWSHNFQCATWGRMTWIPLHARGPQNYLRHPPAFTHVFPLVQFGGINSLLWAKWIARSFHQSLMPTLIVHTIRTGYRTTTCQMGDILSHSVHHQSSRVSVTKGIYSLWA